MTSRDLAIIPVGFQCRYDHAIDQNARESEPQLRYGLGEDEHTHSTVGLSCRSCGE